MAKKKVVTKKEQTRSDDVDEVTTEQDLDTPAPVKRVFKGEHEFYHDLFKLEVANFQKNLSWNPKKPNLIPMEHCHIFHSYDSDGKKQTRCNAIGGHTHEVRIFPNEAGDLVGECSPAIGGYSTDEHTHEVVYQDSQKMKARKMNAEAVKVFSSFDQPIKGAPSPSPEV